MTAQENKIPTIAFVVVIAGIFLWGSSLSFVKIALEEYDPVFLVFARLIIATLLLTPVVLLKCRPIRIYSKRDFSLLILLSCCDPVGFFTFEAVALKYTSASQASMMWALSPMLCTMSAWLVLRERVSRPVVICFIIAMLGVMTLTAGGVISEQAPNPVLGNFLELMSLCCAAAFFIILRSLRGRYPAIMVVWLQSLIGAILFLPALTLDSVTLPAAFNLKPFLAMLYLGIFVSFAAQASSAFGVAHMPVARVAIFNNCIPVLGLFFGLIMLGESLTPIQWGACVFVLIAVAFSQYYEFKIAPKLQTSFGTPKMEQATEK